MSSFEFSPAMCLALDAYRVPPLPQDFAERVVARALAQSRQRPAVPRRASRWRRSGRIVTGIALAGLLSATAAAAGWLGKPVYVPVISQLIEMIAPHRAEIASPVAVPPPAVSPVMNASAEPAPAPPDTAVLASTPQQSPAASQARSEALSPAAAANPVRTNGVPVAPDPIERGELRRAPFTLPPIREPAPPVSEPIPALTRALSDPVESTDPAIRAAPTPARAAPTPARTAAPPPRDVRPAERLRTPSEPRQPRTAPTPTERRQQLRERRIP
jgi:hypothetical protein